VKKRKRRYRHMFDATRKETGYLQTAFRREGRPTVSEKRGKVASLEIRGKGLQRGKNKPPTTCKTGYHKEGHLCRTAAKVPPWPAGQNPGRGQYKPELQKKALKKSRAKPSPNLPLPNCHQKRRADQKVLRRAGRKRGVQKVLVPDYIRTTDGVDGPGPSPKRGEKKGDTFPPNRQNSPAERFYHRVKHHTPGTAGFPNPLWGPRHRLRGRPSA